MKFSEYFEVITREQFAKGSKFRKKVASTFNFADWKQAYPKVKQLFANLGGGSFKRMLVFDAKNFTQNEIKASSADKAIMKFLEKLGYQVTDIGYATGMVFKGEKAYPIKQIINEYKQKLTDFQKFDDRIDSATNEIEKLEKQDAEKNAEKIKALKERIALIEKQKEGISEFKKVNAALAKSNMGDLEGYKIVFHLSPRVIASQSTGVSWTSCQNLESGSRNQFVGSGISAGSFVAWLIKAGKNVTEADIKSPLARVLIKPMENKKGGVYWYVDVLYPHGSPYTWFRTAVGKILLKHNMEVSPDTYNLKKGVYQDSKAQVNIDDAFKYYNVGDFSDLDGKKPEFKAKVIAHYLGDLADRADDGE